MEQTLPGGILLLGDDLPFLTELSIELRSMSRSVVITAAPDAVRRAGQGGFGAPAAAVVSLDGRENIGDMRGLMEKYPGTTFLFLSRTAPPRASIARAVHRGGGEIIPRAESRLVIAATMVAMMAPSHRTAGDS